MTRSGIATARNTKTEITTAAISPGVSGGGSPAINKECIANHSTR